MSGPWVKAEEDWAQLKFWDETSLTPQVVLEPRPLRVAPPQGLPTWSRQKSSWTWWLEGSPNCKSRGCQTFLRFKAWSWHRITSIIFYVVPLLRMARCVSSSCQRNVNVSDVCHFWMEIFNSWCAVSLYYIPCRGDLGSPRLRRQAFLQRIKLDSWVARWRRAFV